MSQNIPQRKLNPLQHLLEKGNIAFYDYKAKRFPNFISSKAKGVARVFLRNEQRKFVQSNSVKVSRYSSFFEIRKENADVCFLDHKAIKVLFARFSISSRYVLVRLAPRLSWLVALPGLIRHLLKGGTLKFRGFIKLKTGNTYRRWLVLENGEAASVSGTSLSSDVGVQGLLDHLNKEKVKYVVLRFFDNLPQLGRPGGDLDLLVLDDDKHKVKEFLENNNGEIRVEDRIEGDYSKGSKFIILIQENRPK